MAQHDFNIDNQSAPAFRGDLNNALEALGTLSSGATAPATTYANMLWYDTADNILYMRSEADDAWISLGTLDQSANTFTPAGLTNLTQGQVEDDTSTVFGQVSGQRLAQAVAANVDVDYGAGNAALAAGAVGSYIFGYGNADKNQGETIAGSSLTASSAMRSDNQGTTNPSLTVGSAQTGTWRCMGHFDLSVSQTSGDSTTTRFGATLWLRIV